MAWNLSESLCLVGQKATEIHSLFWAWCSLTEDRTGQQTSAKTVYYRAIPYIEVPATRILRNESHGRQGLGQTFTRREPDYGF